VKRPPRPTHSYLTDTEVRTLDVLVRRGARALRPEECNRLISLFQHHVGDLQQARRSTTGMRSELAALRRRLEIAEASAAKGDELLAEARMWARHGYELGQRSCTWSDHGVAPAWLTENWDAGTALPTEPGNAEDCPQCGERRDLPYPFLCPGHPAKAAP
jgi:DNA-binding protein H-NS